jgi:hypothetical protein
LRGAAITSAQSLQRLAAIAASICAIESSPDALSTTIARPPRSSTSCDSSDARHSATIAPVR